MAEYARWVKSNLPAAEAAELDRVDKLAARLLQHLEDSSIEVAKVHVHGAKSQAVQSLFALLLKDELGFSEEVVLTKQDLFVTRSRPDFFFELSPGRGVLAEVERGGTTTNNHDLKDLWKTHVAPDAHHLFLIVPISNWKKDGTARERPYRLVARRMGAFFGELRREIDVNSVHVFGY